MSHDHRIKEILKDLERLVKQFPDLIDELWLFLRRHHCKHHRARSLEFTFTWCGKSLKGQNMTFTMLANQSVPVIGSPVQADGSPSPATLSNANYSTSDTSVITVAPDPATPNGAILTGVAAGTAVLNETADATETDNSVNSISGTATIIITAVGPVGPAVALVFGFGTPQLKK